MDCFFLRKIKYSRTERLNGETWKMNIKNDFIDKPEDWEFFFRFIAEKLLISYHADQMEYHTHLFIDD